MTASIANRLRTVAVRTRLHEHARKGEWLAEPWAPEWLDSTNGVPDGAAIAGPPADQRFIHEDLPADPFFQRITGFPTYRTPGQRAACRAVVSVPSGDTVITMLPTGSGKTEVALCLADRIPAALTLIVVPTTALAYDFERRFREHYARLRPGVRRSDLHFAWTAQTPEDVRAHLRRTVMSGKQPLLVTSPESISRSLRGALLDAAAAGRLGGLVIDEAHLVTQWGRSFRPEFRTLGHFRQQLVEKAQATGYPPPTTLLLSATLGAHELKDLRKLFTGPGDCSLIAANMLRPEPDLWTAAASSPQVREEWILEALSRLPRPAILYVTSPEEAQKWHKRLSDAGFRRLGLVTGKTSSDNRARVLIELRSTVDDVAKIDLVVATSAFGLGIDYAHFRSVVHACLPETVDRWYQELGRGGRDGYVSSAFLLTAPGDKHEAESLTTKILTSSTAHRRWKSLWDDRHVAGERAYIDIELNPSTSLPGSYNRRWNAQLLQGLVELGALRRHHIDVEDVMALITADGAFQDWVAVELLRPIDGDSEFWSQLWDDWQRRETSRSYRAMSSVHDLLAGNMSVCKVIATAYEPDNEVLALFGAKAARFIQPSLPCGRCPSCRLKAVQPHRDPPPGPVQTWRIAPEDHAANLRHLVDAVSAENGLMLLHADKPEWIADDLARVLVANGIRHVAGPVDRSGLTEKWIFLDNGPISPGELTPFSSFVIYPAGSRVSRSWLNAKARRLARLATSPALDVVLVASDSSIDGRAVVHELRAFDAHMALQILKG